MPRSLNPRDPLWSRRATTGRAAVAAALIAAFAGAFGIRSLQSEETTASLTADAPAAARAVSPASAGGLSRVAPLPEAPPRRRPQPQPPAEPAATATPAPTATPQTVASEPDPAPPAPAAPAPAPAPPPPAPAPTPGPSFDSSG
jgi:Meckel syndrome type 1 protein